MMSMAVLIRIVHTSQHCTESATNWGWHLAPIPYQADMTAACMLRSQI